MESKFIKIKISDFPYSRFRTPESYFRSLEHYLKKHNCDYSLDDKNCIVNVQNELDAVEIGSHFYFDSVEYFDGLKLQSIKLNNKKMPRSPRTMVTDLATGKIMTLGQFKRYKPEELKNCLKKDEVVRRKILSRAELESAIEKGKLREIKYRDKSYIDGTQLIEFLGGTVKRK